MPLRFAGDFRELEPGSDEGPSLVEARGKIPEAERSRIGRYLASGVVFTVSSWPYADWFTGEKNIAPARTHTDGVWHWRADLPYYVLRYGVALPDAFLQRMQDLNWKCPVLSRQELHALSAQLAFEGAVQQKLRKKQEKEARVQRALERRHRKK